MPLSLEIIQSNPHIISMDFSRTFMRQIEWTFNVLMWWVIKLRAQWEKALTGSQGAWGLTHAMLRITGLPWCHLGIGHTLCYDWVSLICFKDLCFMHQHFYYHCDFKFLPNLEMLSFISEGGHSKNFLNQEWLTSCCPQTRLEVFNPECTRRSA